MGVQMQVCTCVHVYMCVCVCVFQVALLEVGLFVHKDVADLIGNYAFQVWEVCSRLLAQTKSVL
jgi:hypothetical protein